MLDGDELALQEIWRILKPDGKLLMTVPCNKRLQITQNHKIYTDQQLRNMLHKFRYIEIEYVKSPEATYNLALIKAFK